MYRKAKSKWGIVSTILLLVFTKRLAAGRDYFESKKAQSTFSGRHVIGSVRWWLFVVYLCPILVFRGLAH